MKKNRNCGTTSYPVYPMPVAPGMVGHPMPGSMTCNFGMSPSVMSPDLMEGQMMIDQNLEQQINQLTQQVNTLERRVSRLENTSSDDSMHAYNQNKYSSSNYQMM